MPLLDYILGEVRTPNWEDLDRLVCGFFHNQRAIDVHLGTKTDFQPFFCIHQDSNF